MIADFFRVQHMLIKTLVLCCQKKSCLQVVFHIIVDLNPTSVASLLKSTTPTF